MISSLFTGVSGMNANSNAMGVIGDNIANINTTGYKSSRASFANILSKSLTGFTGNEVGRGVSLAGISTIMIQGALETTENSTDMAIHGNGFFIVKDSVGASSYTRAGEFRFDKLGQLVDNNGLVVQGWNMAEVGGPGTGGPTVDIVIPGGGTSPPRETKEIWMDINLDASVIDTDSKNAKFSNTMTVFDSLGNEIDLTLTFEKTANPREWQWSASIPSGIGSVTNPAVATPILFDTNGNLTTSGGATTDPVIELSLNSTATVVSGVPTNGIQTITWDLFNSGGVSNGNVSLFNDQSATTFQSQDGYTAGILQSLGVDEKGVLSGVYSNGTIKPLYQIALADFPSYTGLVKAGGNLYMESLASGQPMMGVAGTGSLGGIIPNALEMSNVDLAGEFVKMITTQRAFQANSRVISASDEILTELINLKR